MSCHRTALPVLGLGLGQSHKPTHLGKWDAPRDRNTRAWHGLRMPGPAPPLGFPPAPVGDAPPCSEHNGTPVCGNLGGFCEGPACLSTPGNTSLDLELVYTARTADLMTSRG